MKWWAFLIFHLPYIQQSVRAKDFIEFLQWDNCRASDASGPYRLVNTSFGLVSPAVSEFNTTFVLGQDFDIVVIKFSIYECKTMRDSDCELFLSVNVPDHCKKMTEKGQFYSIMAEAASPKITCPFKKGEYRITQARCPIEKVANVPMGEYIIYKIVWLFEHHGKRVGCWVMKARKSRVRSRKKKGNEN
ncbi:hypothetical protein GE061_010555 [Apolygus lucorum]|uniref:MD-2-related lipid-recognition domain-containing protein n=1 Tax=Apolygus lucorum TaxID=248454 RepID=A0A6A4JZU8_APOLU|nr:hypothetical protein GE061_010555 [Apolygus lucorum]